MFQIRKRTIRLLNSDIIRPCKILFHPHTNLCRWLSQRRLDKRRRPLNGKARESGQPQGRWESKVVDHYRTYDFRLARKPALLGLPRYRGQVQLTPISVEMKHYRLVHGATTQLAHCKGGRVRNSRCYSTTLFYPPP